MPSEPPVIVAIDQGTSSTKAIAIDDWGTVVGRATRPIAQAHPRPGWVEQDAEEILESVRATLGELTGRFAGRVAAIGLSTQRESAVAWERGSGRPVGPMLGWQDRRTTDRAKALVESGRAKDVRRVTGLPLDPMFSALKIGWLLDSTDADRARSRRGEILVGTVDSWLVYRLTGEHRIEAGNASRTQLLGLDSLDWDAGLLDLFGIPASVLPEVRASDAVVSLSAGLGAAAGIPIAGVLGDSHAALYGHGVRRPGEVKVTYGTGSSVMGLIGRNDPVDPGLARTVAWQIGQTADLAFEGNILSTGATLVWLSGVLGSTPADLADRAERVETLHGVDLVPAFAGLGAPWWDEDARATLTGFTLGTSPDVLARAAVDSIVLQVEDVIAVAERSIGSRIDRILLDGGPSANDWLVQLQADLSQRHVRRSRVSELSALGAAELAARTVGAWDKARANDLAHGDDFGPQLDPAVASARRASWHRALTNSLSPKRSTLAPAPRTDQVGA
jgi:glycerol kinase